MPTELFLLSGIDNMVAEEFSKAMNEAEGEDITLRINSPGGSVFAGWVMAKKIIDHDGTVNMKIDGMAASMAAVLTLFADSVEMTDVARIMIHKASVSFFANDAERELVNTINDDLKKKLNARIDNKKLKELKDVTINSLFAEEEPRDIWLSAKEAKDIGLVDKVVKLKTAEVRAMITGTGVFNIAATAEPTVDPPKKEEPKNITMTLEEFKAQHPAIFAEAKLEGHTEGVKAENDRIGAWMTWVDIDPKAVTEGIKSGEALSATAMSDFTRKSTSPEVMAKAAAEAAAAVEGDDPPKSDEGEKKEVTDLELQVRNAAKLKTV